MALDEFLVKNDPCRGESRQKVNIVDMSEMKQSVFVKFCKDVCAHKVHTLQDYQFRLCQYKDTPSLIYE